MTDVAVKKRRVTKSPPLSPQTRSQKGTGQDVSEDSMTDSVEFRGHDNTTTTTTTTTSSSSSSQVNNDNIMAIEGLSAWESSRKIRPTITDKRVSTVQVKEINEELTCPVCLGILNQTMTVMECLHRFCNDCINSALRFGNKECPTCRAKVASRRSLRPDTNFDSMIATIYPNLRDFQTKEEEVFEQIETQNKHFLESVNQGLERQALTRSSRVTMKDVRSNDPEYQQRMEQLKKEQAEEKARRKAERAAQRAKKKKKKTSSSSSRSSRAKPRAVPKPHKLLPINDLQATIRARDIAVASAQAYNTQQTYRPTSEEVVIEVLPAPKSSIDIPELTLVRPYLKVSGAIRAQHLSHFLETKLGVKPSQKDSWQLFFVSKRKNQFQLFSPQQSLSQIKESVDMGKSDLSLRIYYGTEVPTM